MDVSRLRQIVRDADEATVRIEEIDKRIAETDGHKRDVEATIGELVQDALPRERYEEYHGLSDRLAEARATRREAEASVHRLESRIAAIRERLEELDRDAAQLGRVRKQIAESRTEADEWRVLERACGPDGIQALELDALSPTISGVANNLLEAAYGPRYRLEFRTTRTGGSGSRTKQIEDFLIMVVDSEDGSEQEISTLSGGESVWIKRALYDAFAIVRARNTGVQFLTTFQDEADGALDPDARVRYFAMMEAAHRESGRHHTILITHSSELQQMIEQRVDVTEIGVEEGVTA
jgi:exonuclease SbcC